MIPSSLADFAIAAPEVTLLGVACVVLLLDLFISEARRGLVFTATLVGLAITAYVTLACVPVDGRTVGLGGLYVADGVATVLKFTAIATLAVVLVYSRDYLTSRGMFQGEYFVLSLFVLLGVMVMASASSLLSMYMGIEIMALSAYGLVAFNRENPIAAESAMKYFVLGAIASGTLLYGISILYGVTGSFDLGTVKSGLSREMFFGGKHIGLLFGLAFIVVGVAFKFGAVPFHQWVPDVYHGAPTSVTLLLGSVPKLASFALAWRVLAEGLGPLAGEWRGMLIVLSVLSMVLGNVVAIAQTNIKRMLAYSTISHVGFILLGILTATPDGYAASLYYTVAYVIMAAASFGMVILLSREGFEADRIDDFKGLAQRSPWFAWMMLMVMMSTAGVPPFMGFFAKLYVIQAVLDANLAWLAIVAVLASVVGAYYYLRIVKVMFFDAPEDRAPALQASPLMRIVLSGNALAVLAAGIVSGPLTTLCRAVIPG